MARIYGWALNYRKITGKLQFCGAPACHPQYGQSVKFIVTQNFLQSRCSDTLAPVLNLERLLPERGRALALLDASSANRVDDAAIDPQSRTRG